ncbi:hypothetical protein RFI_17244, partial [Reticulomyxa filosa]
MDTNEVKVPEKVRRMSRQELEVDVVELQQQVEVYQGDLITLRVQMADNSQTLQEKETEIANVESLSVIANDTIDEYSKLQREYAQLKQQLDIVKNNQNPDARKMSELQLEVMEIRPKLETITNERDELKRRVNALWYELKTLQDLYCLDQLQNRTQTDPDTPSFPSQQIVVSMYHSLIEAYHSK